MKQIFTDIVQNWRWKKHPCGPGSTLAYTENLRQQLGPLLREHKITTMFDVPCGDYSWMSQTDLCGVDYQGGDIVEFMIEKNKELYPDVNFCVFDLATDSLPDVDLLFCRDCLLHLSLDDVNQVLHNICRSNIKYILMSNWFEDAENHRDITTGSWRYLDFTAEPYNFGPAIDSIKDWLPGYPRREMMLWPKTVIDNYVAKIT